MPHHDSNPTSSSRRRGPRPSDRKRLRQALGESRLVTVTGPAGIGKTALVGSLLRWLRRRNQPPDGVLVLSLRGQLSAEAIRWSLGRAVGGVGLGEEALFGALADRQFLLVLDRIDDPMTLDREAVLNFLAGLLRRLRGMRVVLTAVRPLGQKLAGVSEAEVALEGLSPEASAQMLPPLPQDEAREALLRQLQGNPLALRLAAPLLRSRPASELTEVLVDRGANGTAWLAVEDLRQTAPEAARLLGVLSLFPGGAMAEDLDAAWGEGWRLPMEELKRRGLLERAPVADTERFTLPASVLVQAASLLAELDGERLIQRATRHLAAMGQTLSRAIDLGGKHAAAAWALFGLEELNLWAVLERKDQAATVAAHLPRLLLRAGRPGDALRSAEVAAAALRRSGDPVLQAESLLVLGALKQQAGDAAGAQAAYDRVLVLYREADDPRGEAEVLVSLAELKLAAGDTGAALRDFELALALYREIQNPLGEAACRQGIGKLRLAEDNPNAAQAEFRLALKIHLEAKQMLGAAADLGYLGRTELAANRPGPAVLLLDEALTRHRALGEPLGEGLDLRSQAEAFWEQNSRTGALAAWWLAREIFQSLHPPTAAEIDRMLAELGERLGEEDYDELLSDLEANAEQRRQASVLLLRGNVTGDAVLDQILESLGR